jgi:HEAT repeat protein
VAAAQAHSNLPASDEAEHTLIMDNLLSAIDDPSDKVCQAAIWSLGMRREASASDQIAEMLTVANPYIAGNALLALARLGDQRIAPDLPGYLEHPNEYMRTQAIRAVALLRHVPSGAAILRILAQIRAERENKGIPRHAMINHLFEAIAALKLKEAIPVLLEIARQDVGLRGKAVETLIALQAEEAAAPLAHMLADPSTNLRRNLLVLMEDFNYQPAIPFIRPLLKDPQPSIRRAALHALRQLGDHESTAAIEWMCLHDPSPFARVEAVYALTQMQELSALPVLHALAADSNFDVRRAVIDKLIAFNTWTESELRIAARFIADFPEDTFSSQLQSILASHPPLPPVSEPAAEPASNLPAALAANRAALAGMMQSWLAALPDSAENATTQAALQHLLSLLN